MTKRMMRALAAGLLVCMLAGSAAATNWDDNYDPFVELPPETSEQVEQTEQTDGTTEAQRFSDVAATDWYYSVVMQLVEAGTIDGFPDGTFRPDATITRAEFVKMLLSATNMDPYSKLVQWMKESNKTNQGPLTDMSSHWLTKQGLTDVALASGLVVVDDYNEHKFQPEKAIARYEIALMADRALGLVYPATHEENIDLSFTDKDTIQDWMRGYIKQATNVGILKGYPDGSFGPKKTATRAEAVVMISRVVNEMLKSTSHKETMTLVFQYNDSYPPHASRVLKCFRNYLNIDGTIYLPADLLLQSWLIVSENYDPSGEYGYYVAWDPISQRVGLDTEGSTTAFYPGNTKYNFNIPIWTIASLGEKMSLVDTSPTPARMLSGQVMIPVYSEQENTGWNSQYENNMLTLLLPEPATLPIS